MTARSYDHDADTGLASPFHESCYDLLRAKISPEAFRTDILYHAFARHLLGDCPRALELDWGNLEQFQSQYFVARKGCEEFLLSPTDIPRLQQYYAGFPHTTAAALASPDVRKGQRASTSADTFAAMPAELLFLLLDELPLHDLFALRLASTVVNGLELTRLFWRSRITRDMPWLYDIPADTWMDDSVDWYTVYKDVFAMVQRGHPDFDLALANRRRIWTTMDQWTGTYFSRLAEVESLTLKILADAKAGRMGLLIQPEPTDTQTSLVALLAEFDDVMDIQPRIAVHWTSHGYLSGLSTMPISPVSGCARDAIGHPELFATSEDFVVPADDWLKHITLITTTERVVREGRHSRDLWHEERHVVGIGFSLARHEPVVFGASDGDRRVLSPMPGNIVVGFMGTFSNNGQVSKLALLEQPRNRFATDCPRLAHAVGAERDTKAEMYLWRTAMPHPRLTVSDQQQGYWGYGVKVDALPMEALIFAETDDEWASVTSIAGDMHMGGFKVEYSDREPRSMGPRLRTMRSMSIDGARGERIASIISHVEHVVLGIRFITNRGRQLAIGLIGSNRTFKQYSRDELEGRDLVGMYCGWERQSLPTSRLETFGVLSRECGTPYGGPIASATDDIREFPWDPQPLPDYLTEHGRLWGEWSYESANQHYSFPKNNSIVGWLDCRRPISEVRVVTCHSQHERRLSVVGVGFSYADAEHGRASIGYTELLTEEEPSVAEFGDWCQCRPSQPAPHPDDGPHCHADVWKPEHQRLRAIRIWLDKHGAVSGMHFVDVAERESPFWGFKSDEGSRGEICFDDKTEEEQAVGIKFFMNDINRHVTYEDVVVVALQAVVKA